MSLKSCVLAVLAGMALPLTVWAQPRAELTIGMYRIVAEVAADEPSRERGLMFRQHLGANEGMVFVFPAAGRQCMWMKNTLIPLSVAFLDDKGKIINIEEMKEQTTDSHCATKPATYALEMNKGWFRQKNIKPGMTIEGLPQLTTVATTATEQ